MPRGVTPKATAKFCDNFCTSPRLRFHRCGLTNRSDTRTSFSDFLSFETQWLTLRFTPELGRFHTAFKIVFFAIRFPNIRPVTPPSVPEFLTLTSLRSNSHDAIRDRKHGRSEGTVTCPFFHPTRLTFCPPTKSKRNASDDR